MKQVIFKINKFNNIEPSDSNTITMYVSSNIISDCNHVSVCLSRTETTATNVHTQTGLFKKCKNTLLF